MYKHRIRKDENYTILIDKQEKIREREKTEMRPGLSDRNHKRWNPRADRAALIDRLPSEMEERTANSQIQRTLWFLEDKNKVKVIQIRNAVHQEQYKTLIINQWG